MSARTAHAAAWLALLLLAPACGDADDDPAATGDAALPGSPDAAPPASPDAGPDAGPAFACAPVDGSDHPAILALAANLGGGQPLAVSMANNHTAGVTIAIRDADGVVVTAVFGHAANAAFDPAAPPLGPSTLFQAASISKTVSALAYLVSDADATTLDADIAPTIADLLVPPYPITPAELLSHSAGITVHGFVGYREADPLPSVDDIVLGAGLANTPAVGFGAPGHFDYSGGGYMLWQAWLERTVGESLAAFVHAQLLAPAQATRSSFAQPLPAAEHDAACGYVAFLPANTCRLAFPEHAAAGLWTTPSDLVCVAGYVAERRPDVLAQVTTRALVTGTPQRMGLGLFHRPANGVDETDGHFFEHSGVNPGMCAQLVFFDDGRAIAVMDNGCAGISHFVVRALCRELAWPCAGPGLAP